MSGWRAILLIAPEALTVRGIQHAFSEIVRVEKTTANVWDQKAVVIFDVALEIPIMTPNRRSIRVGNYSRRENVDDVIRI